jgi:hypothetical protein
VWRLASNLIYFGTIAQPGNYLFHSYFMYVYLRDLEENVFERKSDLVYLFIFAAAVMEVNAYPCRALPSPRGMLCLRAWRACADVRAACRPDDPFSVARHDVSGGDRVVPQDYRGNRDVVWGAQLRGEVASLGNAPGVPHAQQQSQ